MNELLDLYHDLKSILDEYTFGLYCPVCNKCWTGTITIQLPGEICSVCHKGILRSHAEKKEEDMGSFTKKKLGTRSCYG